MHRRLDDVSSYRVNGNETLFVIFTHLKEVFFVKMHDSKFMQPSYGSKTLLTSTRIGLVGNRLVSTIVATDWNFDRKCP
jgi:hypothetical protein